MKKKGKFRKGQVVVDLDSGWCLFIRALPPKMPSKQFYCVTYTMTPNLNAAFAIHQSRLRPLSRTEAGKEKGK